jgi:hypothetical protein
MDKVKARCEAKDLPEPIKTWYFANARRQKKNISALESRDVNSISWEDTIEGSSFWNAVYEGANLVIARHMDNLLDDQIIRN